MFAFGLAFGKRGWFQCLAAAKAYYNLYRAAVRPLLPLPQRLIEIARRTDVIDLDNGLIKMSDATLKRAPPFRRTTRSSRREILFIQAQRGRFFPDFREIKRDRAFSRWFKCDKKRSTVRQLRQGNKKDPVYRFFLPDDGG